MINHPAEELEPLLEFLQSSRGFDFSGYKRTSLTRRIEKRTRAVGVALYSDYIAYLEVHPEEFPRLFDTLLIKVTGFFRDAAAWDRVAGLVVPRLLSDRPDGGPIRVWSAGCAWGGEPYTLAMIFAEALGREKYLERVKIYGTDIDEEALKQARRASYEAEQVAGVPPDLLAKYFRAEGGRYHFDAELRRATIFGRHDLIRDVPISRVDFLSCRNTLMYFNAETQTRVLLRLHSALAAGGVLFLGRAEMLLKHAHLFEPIDLKRRLFRTNAKSRSRSQPSRAVATPAARAIRPFVSNAAVRESAFDAAPIALIVISTSGVLTLANERARVMFGIGQNDIGRRIEHLELSFRPLRLAPLIEQVYAARRWITVKDVPRATESGDAFLDVQVLPLYDRSGAAVGVEVSFFDVTSQREGTRAEPKRARGQLAEEVDGQAFSLMDEDIESGDRKLASTIEDLETTSRDLQSSNEELQSTNEELKTLNDELRQRADDLGRESAFSSSIVGSLHEAVIVIDSEFVVEVWNPRAGRLFGVESAEAVGRNLLKLDIGLPIEFLKGTIRSCLVGESDYVEVAVRTTGRRGRAIRCKVICLSHVRPDARRGAILLMEDESLKT
jgi:two-component system, chemotaxis family, CheB/CheR fusion protein